mmetsp:Transcript_16222/g.45218  ORF Transcript_16222/g.45218 Transcript_16222/m.45218 type:complete len:100 (+) Transcript_16222:1055-1354(+)
MFCGNSAVSVQLRAPNDAEIKKSLQVIRKEERDTKTATAAAFRGKLASKPPVATDGPAGPQSPNGGRADSGQDVLLTYSVPGILLWLWQSLIRMLFGQR